ncbi:MAG TPA: YIP1 family protein [Bryobacteraceae bacterium]|jgi:hypothetical protein|nr:YIP1 family protein [Bryobacteraceae bacterium]
MTPHAAAVPAPAEPVAGIGDGLAGILNIFVDPAGAARRIVLRMFWIYPIIVMCAVSIFQQIMLAPFTLQVQRKVLQDRNMSPEQIQNSLAMMSKFAFIGYIIAPIFVVLFCLLSAWLISVAGSIVDVRARFQHLFSLVAVCGMFYMLQIIAQLIILRTKSPDDVQSRQDLQPPLGLDIFLHDLPKGVQGVVSFFSVFEIWSIVMMALTYAALTKTSKGKAFFATAPGWIVGLVFAVLGSMFAG